VISISDRIAAVHTRVSAALARSGREAGSVTVVAVTKTFPADAVNAVIRAGILDIGENRVQEMLAKAEQVSGNCRWHLVGPLQRNKAPKVVGFAYLMHAIDGVAIAQTVDRLARERGLGARVLLEVNTSGEASKHGIVPADADGIADILAALPNLDWQGLMTMGPATGDATDTRRCFASLASLATALRTRTGLPLPELSMGMSGDFEIAIEEGATIVRLGRVLLGERQ
jgi:pyridoxal phosphate enzyme (YggS family)